MSVTYKKLRVMLVEKNMKKKDLQEQAGLTHHEMLKIRKDMDITTETIGKICKAMKCEPTDIMDFYEEKDKNWFNCPAFRTANYSIIMWRIYKWRI